MYTFYIGTKNFLNEMTKHPVTEPYLITLSAPFPAVKIKNLPALLESGEIQTNLLITMSYFQSDGTEL